eukprot:CAMPEP_0197465396 /NCGR_PEP_ID=MMETSP1175-20131217/64516_1 /TAXON_ID=1003142 /ORGANISM="Triceratium dubium, Strain CCMP147" /LENGTH=352 /DNA_ID=CAMNT_0043001409 /DNA_START=816 /DNA_END=1877 /DNA_ORIENTATION=+
MEREGKGIVQFVALSDRSDFSRSTGGGVVVGAADAKFVEAARALTFQLPARVHVENLRVHAKARRLGIGTALLSAVVRYAREETVADMVTLKVEPDNRGAVDLYLKEGFFFYEDVHVGFMAMILDDEENDSRADDIWRIERDCEIYHPNLVAATTQDGRSLISPLRKRTQNQCRRITWHVCFVLFYFVLVWALIKPTSDRPEDDVADVFLTLQPDAAVGIPHPIEIVKLALCIAAEVMSWPAGYYPGKVPCSYGAAVEEWRSSHNAADDVKLPSDLLFCDDMVAAMAFWVPLIRIIGAFTVLGLVCVGCSAEMDKKGNEKIFELIKGGGGHKQEDITTSGALKGIVKSIIPI